MMVHVTWKCVRLKIDINDFLNVTICGGGGGVQLRRRHRVRA